MESLGEAGRAAGALRTQGRSGGAGSPQAKGRIERNHGTQQDRLIKKMRLLALGDDLAANAYLSEQYLPQHNTRFAVMPASAVDHHRVRDRRSRDDDISASRRSASSARTTSSSTKAKGCSLIAPLGAACPAWSAEAYHSGEFNRFELNRVETSEYDGLGNRVAQRLIVREFERDTIVHDPATGRVTGMWWHNGDKFVVQPATVYDEAGNEHLAGRSRTGSACEVFHPCNGAWKSFRTPEVVANYYSADQKLRVSDRETLDPKRPGGLEEYRYDALGRRVLRRYRGDGLSQSEGGSVYAYDAPLVRYVYDGDQILYEIGRRGHDSTFTESRETDIPVSDADTYFGIVQYRLGPSLDKPLSATRIDYPFWVREPRYSNTIFLHANWKGQFDNGSHYNQRRDRGMSWNSRRMTSQLARVAGSTQGGDEAWFGSLLDVQTDGSLNVYMRNRYYDPASGRFTQEDPIGLAGGLNLYGFANGDPVNFSDPFGLCANPTAGGLGSLQCFLEDAWAGGKTAASNAWQSYRKWRDSNAANCDVQCIAMGWSGGMTVVGGLDGLAASAARAEAGELSAAGRALEKHGSRTGSVFPRAVGNAAAKNAAGQSIVEDILTSPGARKVDLTSGRFKGGFDIYAPDGRGVRYDAGGKFITFLEPPR